MRWVYEFFFFSSRRRHTRLVSDWSSDVCSSDLIAVASNAEGRFPALPEWPTAKCVLWRSRLLLLRVTRCRELPGQTADDAVLTLSILSIRPGAAFYVAAKRSGLPARSVNESPNTHLHHLNKRHVNQQ